MEVKPYEEKTNRLFNPGLLFSLIHNSNEPK